LSDRPRAAKGDQEERDMRIRKYDFDFSRRSFMEKVATGASAGVLAPLWPTIASSADNVSKAYPDELLSIELYTKGKIKPGDVLTPNNVDAVKDLLDEVAYKQVKEQGRKIRIKDSTKDVTTLFNNTYLDKTLKNKGRGKFGEDGNVWTDGKVGNHWLGGLPFPDITEGAMCMANLCNNWGRHDYSQYAIPSYSMDPGGNDSYFHEFLWTELQVTGRNDGTIYNNFSDKLRYNTVFFTAPNDTKGSSFLSIWYYDQRKFPDLYGYFPAFKRVRQFPTNQRFEPLVPGITLFLSDAWGAGDPMLTWGDFKIIERKPFLGAVSGSHNWYGAGKAPNWEPPRNGGGKGRTFWDTTFELVPEAIVWDSAPIGYPRSPVGRRREWMDARNGMMISQVTYDRRNQCWKQFEPGFGQFKNEKGAYTDKNGHPDWSWLYCTIHDIQTNRMTLLRHGEKLKAGYASRYDDAGEDVYNKYMTSTAINRLGL
jgi:hypothetical protein